MKIFIDFDHTIFDTERFKKDMLNLFGKYGITPEEFRYSMDASSKDTETEHKKYNPQSHISYLEKSKAVNLNELAIKFTEFLQDLSVYVFEDFYDFYKYFKEHEFYLVSFGDYAFQKNKIMSAGLWEYFEKVDIMDGKKGPVIEKLIQDFKDEDGSRGVFIDDSPYHLDEVKVLLKNIITIRMKRLNGKYNDKEAVLEHVEVKDFNEVKNVLT